MWPKGNKKISFIIDLPIDSAQIARDVYASISRVGSTQGMIIERRIERIDRKSSQSAVAFLLFGGPQGAVRFFKATMEK